MIAQDIILLIKKIVVGIILFLIPLCIIGGILWLIQFFFFK
jgi:hypothetical protein